MKNNYLLLGFIITIILVVLATTVGIYAFFLKDAYYFTSLSGVVVEIYGGGIYQHHTTAQVYQVIPHDFVTLAIALPAFIISFYFAYQEKLLGQLIFTAITLYLCFTYTIYTFYAFYNQFFIIYLSIMGITFYMFIYLLSILKPINITEHISRRYNKKVNTLFLVIIPSLMGFFWLSEILPVTFTGNIPERMLSHTQTLVPHAIDLAFLLPLVIVSGLQLKNNKPFGYLMSFIVPLFLIVMMLTVLAKGVMMYIMLNEPVIEMMVFIGSFFIFSTLISFINIKSLIFN